MSMNATKTFLHVEDDPHDVELVENALKQLSVRINLQSVRDGVFAKHYMEGRGKYADRESHPLPDVIILDLKMPRLDGFEFLAWLRTQSPATQRLTPVVVMSSSAIIEDVQRAYTLGANSYLVKPVNAAKFDQCVNTLAAYWTLHAKTPEIRNPCNP
jgi:CheY-like chemotaxis protein